MSKNEPLLKLDITAQLDKVLGNGATKTARALWLENNTGMSRNTALAWINKPPTIINLVFLGKFCNATGCWLDDLWVWSDEGAEDTDG